MRTILRSLLSLLFAFSAIAVSGQVPSFYRSTLDWAKSSQEIAPNITNTQPTRTAVPLISYPGINSDGSNLRLAPNALSGGGGAALASAICGPDTVFYPLAKATGFEILRFSDSLAFGQYFDAPQAITVRGFSFYAYVDSSTSQTVNLTCRLYLAGADSLPTGNPLATTTVNVDSNFYGGSLALLEKYASWTGVVVNAPYVITVENNTPVSAGIITNDFSPVSLPRDGLQEWLGQIYVPGATSAWVHGYGITIGPNPFDADVLLHPHVTYDITAGFGPTQATGCTNIAATLTNMSSPIIQNRMYNFAAFQGNAANSFNWNYGDGSAIDNVINGNHAYTTAGTYTVTLTDSMFGWNVTCTDAATGTIVVSPGQAITANFSYTSAGLAATFSDMSNNSPTTWVWDFGDGNTSMMQNPSHTYTSNGTYTVCLVASNACNIDTFCQTVLVGALPASSCDTIGNITGTPTLYSATNGGFVAGHNFRHDSAKAESFALGGTFAFEEALYFFGLKRSPTPMTSKVIATVWDANGMGGSPGAVLATQDLLYSQIDTTGALTSVTFPSVIGTNGNFYVGLQLIYTPGDTIALITNAIGQTIPATAWELDSAGTNWVAYDDTSTWGIGVSHAIWVIQTVEAAFTQATAGLSATFTDQSLGATGWQWDFGDGNSSTMQSPSHTYAMPGTYTVCQIALNNTCVDTICQTVTVSGACPNPTA
ncbi:MAG TPA: PKD domain-containing protein, partial [Bacteroidetes bacterium]|nr:PKD domain-containing protein [Bacteroidota bacterium]